MLQRNLHEICQTLLDNADLTISMDSSGVIRLEFVPASEREVVIFLCGQFSRFNYRKNPEDTNAVFVGETHVAVKENKRSVAGLRVEDGWLGFNSESLKPAVHVEIEGGAMLNIVCENFSWQVGEGEVQTVL